MVRTIKSCAYTSLRALLEQKKPVSTAVGLFADKEEIGSMGNTGAESFVLQNFAYEFGYLLGLKTPPTRLLENAKSISADVTAGVNPNYKDVHDLQNASYIGKGVSVEKYGGAGGKYSSNDTHAEYYNLSEHYLIKNTFLGKQRTWKNRYRWRRNDCNVHVTIWYGLCRCRSLCIRYAFSYRSSFQGRYLFSVQTV
jgi:hypothetical protein